MFSSSELAHDADMCVSKRKIDKENQNQPAKKNWKAKKSKQKQICTEGVSENIMQRIPWETEIK
jgi:hypothetical protein